MLNSYFQETCTHHSNTYNRLNERIEVDAPENCKIVHERKRVKNDMGEDVVSEIQLYLRRTITIGMDDMFTVDGRKHPIITYSQPRAFINAYGHTEVFL